MLRELSVWVVRSMIVLLSLTFIMSLFSPDFSLVFKGVFGDVFSYSSREAQNQAIRNLEGACSSLDKGRLITIKDICTDSKIFEDLKTNCEDLRDSKIGGLRVENEDQMKKTCSQLQSGELQQQCKNFNEKEAPTVQGLEGLCSDRESGKLSDKEFFVGVISSPSGNQNIDSGQIPALQKYNSYMRFLNDNKIYYLLVLGSLFVILYLLVREPTSFLLKLSGIAFSIGTIILIPFSIATLYVKFAWVDTSPILSIIFGEGSFDISSIISVLMLLILRIYQGTLILIAGFLLIFGIFGKIYKHTYKDNPI